ncbi:DUF3375 domain-containing protein [Nocardioides alcanivorans]|uniref:DUF3375 domain-containing protein n=1 Tax=Nocardioides alcanivorans TaxID=2897352 RepID=UPI001F446615|nr:DUF3375 domain-containing protein [Nocardioides alcanivorans]
MSEIVAELARVQGAFAQPTLTLLHQRQAPVVTSIFRTVFGRSNLPIPTARLHTQVDVHLEALRQAGQEDVPPGTGRDLCHRWMRGQWLVRALDETGQEVYSLTSHAQQALELVKTLARDRATLSEHRIATILGSVRRFNAEANPDRTTRVSILNTEIARMTAERDRLVDGAEMVSATEDYMQEGYAELLSLISALPSDFARVEERFAGIRAEILAAFRAEDRPPGEVIDDYLARADALMTSTHEGRAFEGAFALLRDDALVAQLRGDLSSLLEHPLSDRILADHDRAELRGTVKLIRDGLDRALAQRSKVTATLKEYIVAHDGGRDRGLEQTLRQIEAEMMTWLATTGPRTTLDLQLLPSRVGIDHLRERFHDPADDVPPEPIVSADPDDAPEVSLAELMAQGGPHLRTLRERLDLLLTREDERTLGEFFDELEPSLRRPVEIFGLLHLAADHDWEPEEALELYRSLRPDGTGREFAVPRLPLNEPASLTDASQESETTA